MVYNSGEDVSAQVLLFQKIDDGVVVNLVVSRVVHVRNALFHVIILALFILRFVLVHWQYILLMIALAVFNFIEQGVKVALELP